MMSPSIFVLNLFVLESETFHRSATMTSGSPCFRHSQRNIVFLAAQIEEFARTPWPSVYMSPVRFRGALASFGIAGALAFF
jgi:hypothetical protein